MSQDICGEDHKYGRAQGSVLDEEGEQVWLEEHERKEHDCPRCEVEKEVKQAEIWCFGL
jgi:hypothetical protein